MDVNIALTAKWPTFPERIDWIVENGFALEYAPDPEKLEILPNQLDPYLKKGLLIRYHGFMPGYEIGHQDPDIAETGLMIHKSVLDSIHGRGEQVLTIHIGLRSDDPIDAKRAIRNLTRLVEYGNEIGIIVCLENLRRGYTSDPKIVADWAKKSGAKITFDIGHAVSCERVQSGQLSAQEFLTALMDRLHEIHLYGSETDRHYPPKDINSISDLIDLSMRSDCRWWTIELDDYNEALFTRNLVLDYLKEGR